MGFTKNLILSLSILAGSFSHAQAQQPPAANQIQKVPVTARIVQETTRVLKTARPEVGVGMSYFEKQNDGVWYQEAFPYHLDMTSISASIGFVFKISEQDFIRLGYSYLGKVQTEALATASDEDYAVCKHDTSTCWPLSHWYGKGHTKQFYLTYDRSFRVLGVVMVVEAGLVMNKVDWEVHVPDWIPARDAEPRYIIAKHDAIWRPSGSIGAGVQLDDRTRVMVTLNRAMSNNDETYSISRGKVLTVTIVRKF